MKGLAAFILALSGHSDAFNAAGPSCRSAAAEVNVSLHECVNCLAALPLMLQRNEFNTTPAPPSQSLSRLITARSDQQDASQPFDHFHRQRGEKKPNGGSDK